MVDSLPRKPLTPVQRRVVKAAAEIATGPVANLLPSMTRHSGPPWVKSNIARPL
jgi:hypothetical protein